MVTKEKLGQFIHEVSVYNKKLEYDNLLGVSTQKIFISSVANTNGTDFSKYKIVSKKQFTYVPDTSRRGDKIAIALYLDDEPSIVSSAYTVFEIVSDKLLPEFLMLWFDREEFDRLARFKSYGSVREIFDWNEMCNLEIPLPDIETQKQIIKLNNIFNGQISLYERINNNLLDLYKAKYYSLFDGLEVTDEILEHIIFTGGAQPPKSEHIYEKKEGYVRFIQNRDYSSNSSLTYIKNSKRNKLCNEYDIMMDKYGDVGSTRFGLEGAYNVALAKIECKNELYKEYIRGFLMQDSIYSFINNAAIASTRGSLNENVFKGLKIAIPSDESLHEFNKIGSAIIKKIVNNRKKKYILEDLRKKIIIDKLFS